MSLTLHLVKKDLRHLRLPAGLWVLLVGAQIYFSNQLLSGRSINVDWFVSMSLYVNGLILLGLLVCYLMTAMLVLADPLCGTQMFWVTRPIASRRLLAAKLVTAIALFVVLPVLLWLPWWLYCGFGPAALARTAGQLLLFQAAAVLPAFALAVLVDQIGRFLLYSVVLVAGWFVIALNFFPSVAGLDESVRESRLILAAVVLAVFALATAVWQYASRRTVAGSVLLGAGVLLASTVLFFSPIDVTRWRSRPELPDNAAIQVRVLNAEPDRLKDRAGMEQEAVTLNLQLTGVPEGLAVSGGQAAVELRWPDGAVVRQEKAPVKVAYYFVNGWNAVRHVLGVPLPSRTPERRHWDEETNAKLRTQAEWARGIAARLPQGAPQVPPHLTVTISLPPELAVRLKREPPACVLSLWLEARRPEIIGQMPVTTGAAMTSEGRLSLVGLGRASTAVEPEPAPRQPIYLATMTVSRPAVIHDDVHFFRVTPAHGDVQFVASRGYEIVVPMAARITCMPFNLYPSILWRTDKWVEEPGWQDSTKLAAVLFNPAGGFSREIRTDRLVLPGN